MTGRQNAVQTGRAPRVVGVDSEIGRTVGRRTRNGARPLRPGQARCPICLDGAQVMADGTYRGHGSRPGISCPASRTPVPAAAERAQ